MAHSFEVSGIGVLQAGSMCVCVCARASNVWGSRSSSDLSRVCVSHTQAHHMQTSESHELLREWTHLWHMECLVAVWRPLRLNQSDRLGVIINLYQQHCHHTLVCSKCFISLSLSVCFIQHFIIHSSWVSALLLVGSQWIQNLFHLSWEHNLVKKKNNLACFW